MQTATAPIEPATEARVEGDWSLARRVGFRFAFTYFILYWLPAPLDSLPFTGWIVHAYGQVTQGPVNLFAGYVLRVPVPLDFAPTGSSDTLSNWCWLATTVALSVAVTAIWSCFAKARQYETLRVGLRCYLRYCLAAMMLNYGYSKLFPLQFRGLDPGHLHERVGELSPMGLLWTFMGASRPYAWFGGFVETLGAGLLFFRRTASLGALILTGVLFNVVLLNFSYDVPVKVLSVNLLVQVIYLASADGRRLLDLLVLDRPTQPRPPEPLLFAKLRPRVRSSLKAALVLTLVIGLALSVYGGVRARGQPPKTPFTGTWQVQSFTPPGDATSAHPAWTEADFISNGLLFARRADGERVLFWVRSDAGGRVLSFQLLPKSGAGPGKPFSLAVSHPSADELELKGPLEGVDTTIHLRRHPDRDWNLLNRGFHWVSPAPFNR